VPPTATTGGKPIKVETITGTKVYTGAPIKIDAKNLDLLDALRAIAEVSGLNIITSDDVKGKVTLKLDNVPWDQALDLILETKGLGMVQYGNVIRVAPIKEIQKEREDVIKNLKQQDNLRPLQTRIVPLNFSKATEIQPQVKSILTERGTVDTDRRTNSLIIKDIPEKIQEAQLLIGSLDIQTRQVLIEARILEATVGVTRELGVQWGINYNAGPAWGNGTGVNFPNNIQMGGAVLGGMINPISPINLNTSSAQGGAIGLSLGSLTDSISLDMLLKAMETQNKVKIISNPRIMTMDNQRATIQQGVTIPYPPAVNLSQGAGATQWQFVEAALRLEVTPHISPDGTVILDLKVSNNQPNQLVVSGGSPSIDKKEAETTVIVKDGQTIVIGGIYKKNETETTNETPFLGKIPILGKLFQDKLVQSTNNELLIFLTPRVIK
jgi:type IV pilus assembly protein PilQ